VNKSHPANSETSKQHMPSRPISHASQQLAGIRLIIIYGINESNDICLCNSTAKVTQNNGMMDG